MADKQNSIENFKFDLSVIRGQPELRWTGKRPFTSTQFFPAQRREAYGDSEGGWWNKLFWGDNLQVMSHLLKEFRGSVDFAYLDPPFDSKADYKKRVKTRGQTLLNDSSGFEEKQYSDLWTSDEYLQFMYERLVLVRELLSENGTVMLHVDWHKSHYLRLVLDELFGQDNFLNEIIWHYYNKMQGNVRHFAKNHDNILWYRKGDNYTFNNQRELRDKPKKQQKRVWDPATKSLKQAKDEEGNLIYYEDTHRTIDDVWRLSYLMPADKVEPTGYPTQKPETLIERALAAATEPGDLVFDCFMGSGTTQAVAMKLGRRFIGADINLGSIETTIQRLNKRRQEIETGQLELLGEHQVKQHFTGFEVYNVNNYDIFRNPVEAKELIKDAMELQPLPTSSIFDGQRDQFLVKIMPVNRIATRQDLNEVIAGMDFKAYERRQADAPSKIVDRIMLVCMGHEPDIGPELVKAAKPFNIEVEVVDLIRDKANLHFKRQSEAKLEIKGGHLEIAGFYPLNLLQKLSMETNAVEDWRQLVETVKVDWNYDGAVLSPEVIDAPDKDELVSGRYLVPEDASTIRVKITDLLSESWEGEIENG